MPLFKLVCVSMVTAVLPALLSVPAWLRRRQATGAWMLLLVSWPGLLVWCVLMALPGGRLKDLGTPFEAVFLILVGTVVAWLDAFLPSAPGYDRRGTLATGMALLVGLALAMRVG